MGSDLCRELMPWFDQVILVKWCMMVIMGIAKEPLGANLLPLKFAELFHARASLSFGGFAGSNCALLGFLGYRPQLLVLYVCTYDSEDRLV